MKFLKNTFPLLITFTTGFLVILAFFAGPAFPGMKSVEEEVWKWTQIIFAFTMLLGVLNLLKVNLMKIQKRVDGWGYNLVLVVSFVTMSVVGFLGGLEPEIAAGQTCFLVGSSRSSGEPVQVLSLERGAPVTGSSAASVEFIEIQKDNGEKQRVPGKNLLPPFAFRIQQVQQFFFNGIFRAGQATMFSLLAFFVASASYRAFRVRTVESGILMGAAFIVMLGNTPLGNSLNAFFASMGLTFVDIPALKEWTLTYPSSAAQTAIWIGAVLGYIAFSIKILLGAERSHLGGSDGA